MTEGRRTEGHGGGAGENKNRPTPCRGVERMVCGVPQEGNRAVNGICARGNSKVLPRRYSSKPASVVKSKRSL